MVEVCPSRIQIPVVGYFNSMSLSVIAHHGEVDFQGVKKDFMKVFVFGYQTIDQSS